MTVRLARLLAAFLASAALAAVAARADTLFALVDTGELFASTDQGEKWNLRGTLPVHDAVALAAGSSNEKLRLASRAGGVYASADGGSTWTAIGSIGLGGVVDLAITPGFECLALTAGGTVCRSLDGGDTWAALAALPASDFASLATGPAGLFALTRGGFVFRSTDGGATWTPRGGPLVSDAVRLRAIGQVLHLLTGSGDLFRSGDAGATWQPLAALSQVGMTSLVRDGATLLAATRQGMVTRSADGTSWTWCGAIDQLNVLALGVDTPATADVAPASPRALALAPPHPNPARAGDALGLALELPSADVVACELFDLAGRRVAARAPEPRPAGSVALTWRPQVHAAGVYLLRVSTRGGGAARARVVLLP